MISQLCIHVQTQGAARRESDIHAAPFFLRTTSDSGPPYPEKSSLVRFHHIRLPAGKAGRSVPSLLLSNRAAAGGLLGDSFFLFSAFAVSISLIKTTDLFIFSGRERGGGANMPFE